MDATPAPRLDEPKTGRLTIQYAPEAATEITENPPRFSWLPVIEDEAHYVLRVSTDPGFAAGDTQSWTGIPLNFFTPDVALAPGTWHWSYAVCDPASGKPVSGWSKTRQFTLTGARARKPRCRRAPPALPTPPRATRGSGSMPTGSPPSAPRWRPIPNIAAGRASTRPRCCPGWSAR